MIRLPYSLEGRLRRLKATIRATTPYVGILPARTGKIDDVTGKLLDNPCEGLEAGWIWTRQSFDNGSTFSRAAVPALCMVRNDFADYDVVTGYNTGGYLVAFAGRADIETAARYGVYMAGLGAPIVPAEITNTTLDNAKLLDGLITKSTYGGLNVSIQSFNTPFNVFPLIDPFDVSSAVPGSTGETGWAVLSVAPDFDPTSMTTASASILISLSTPVTFDPTTYAQSAQAITDAAQTVYLAGNIRLGAVLLTHGQLVIDSSTPILDLRSPYEPSGALLAGDTEAQTIASGAITTGNKSVMVVTPETGTSDTLDTITLTGAPRELWLIASTGATISLATGGNLSQATTFTDSQPAHVYHNGATGYVLAAGALVGTFYQTVQVGGSAQTQQPILDLIAGANITLTPTNDAPGTRTKVQIDATTSGGTLASDKKILSTGNKTITSTTFVDIDTGLDITITTGAHRCLVSWTLSASNSVALNNCAVDVQIDGTRVGQAYGLIFAAGTTSGENLSGTYLTDVLTAASHTFKLMGRVDGGTGTFVASTTVTAIIHSVVELNA